MPLMTYEDTVFMGNLPDQQTLRSVFDVARKIPEAWIAKAEKWLEENKDSVTPLNDSRPQYMDVFAKWMSGYELIANLPDLDEDSKTRVIAVDLINQTLLQAMVEGSHATVQMSNDLKLATAHSVDNSFYHAVIAELEGIYINNEQESDTTIAEKEYRILNVKLMFQDAGRFINRGAAFKGMERKAGDLHPKEYKNWGDVIQRFDAVQADGIPATLYQLAEERVSKLRDLYIEFTPVKDNTAAPAPQ